MKIVIVDDDKAIRSLLRAWCEEAGHTIDAEYDSGENLVTFVNDNQPDVVLLDYQLKGANGLELLAALDTKANQVDVIMITGSDDSELQGRAADLGVRGFVRKPIDQLHLISELKVIEESRQIVARATPSTPLPAANSAAQTSGKVVPNSALIIDDSAAVRLLLMGILQGIKIHVTGLAAGAKEGLSLVKKTKPALIFLDVEMPGMSGIEALPLLREASPSSAIAIVTGNASRNIVEAAASGGAKGYFLKPVRPAKVEEFVKKLLLSPVATTPPSAVETFAWTQEWSVGVPGLDRDHQHLVETINRLSGSMSEKNGHPREVAKTLLNDLAEYGQKHFKSEEAYMSHIGYKGLDSHILEHRDFVEKIGAFTISAACGVLDPTELYRFLVTWLRGHVFGSDMLFKQP